jgi:tripartite-type tricarboxylate transporter receptor subunit TctC
MGVAFPNILVVPSDSSIKTLKDFVDQAKKDPGKITFASTGNGSASHLQGELFNVLANIDTTHVPYKGGSPALVDVLGGRVKQLLLHKFLLLNLILKAANYALLL